MTYSCFYAKLHPCSSLEGWFCLKASFKSLLPKKADDRDALTHQPSNIKPRLILSVVEGLWRLKFFFPKIVISSLVVLFLLGYYPLLTFPPVKQSQAKAAPTQEAEIIANTLPQPIILPHPGYLSTRFSNWHQGIDIASGLGMPIHPITKGVVKAVAFDFWGLGHHIIISHPNEFKSTYGHLGRIFVKAGQEVTASNIIGEVGLTGHTSGPHTHLEITKDDHYLDPLTILPPLQDFPSSEYLKPVGGEQQPQAKTNLHKSLKPDF